MTLAQILRARIKAGRRRNATWVRLLDMLRPMASARGRAELWTRLAHRADAHQLTSYTEANRYPELFAAAEQLARGPARILSFGCSTGEELESLRSHFPEAEIIGAEINPRSRRIARGLLARDTLTSVVAPRAIAGTFDLIFALAVLQREPHKIEELGVSDLTPYYPFGRFNAAIVQLTTLLEPGGLLCVANAQYRVEDCAAAAELQEIPEMAEIREGLFGPNGMRLNSARAAAIFRKL